MMLLGVTAYDLAPSPDGWGWVRLEEIHQEEHPGATSHDSFALQAYGMSSSE